MTCLLKKQFSVYVIESEAGWGQKVDFVKTFDTLENANAFVKEFNSKNNLPYVPDWYMYAENPIEIFTKVKEK
jgi:hypothetical protein